MKYHFDFLPTKFDLHVIKTEISPFLYNRVESFSVGRKFSLTAILESFSSYFAKIAHNVENRGGGGGGGEGSAPTTVWYSANVCGLSVVQK